MRQSLEKPIYLLLQKEPFYAHFLLGCKVSFDVTGVTTAACRVVKDHIEFIFNTEFMASMPTHHQVGVIKHEILHVLLEHTGVRGGIRSDRKAKNIAMDCAINQYIEDLPEGAVTLAKLSDTLGVQLSPLETWEYYYEHIKVFRDKNPDKCKDESDHHVMEGGDQGADGKQSDLTEAGAALKKALIKDAMSKAAYQAAGNLPANIQQMLAKMTQPAQLSWKQILNNFVANTRTVLTKSTRQKPHRRFDLDQPGKKKIKKLKLGVCIDESGSVSDESFIKFMVEIRAIAKNTTVTYLVHADCDVAKIETIKNGKVSNETFGTRYASGGTAYAPAINACVQRDCDAIIYLGDMDSADRPNNPGVPFLWVRVGNQDPPGDFGKVLDLK